MEYRDCSLWLYKGVWQEWNIEEIEMAIPMSPDPDLGLTYYTAMEAFVRWHY